MKRGQITVFVILGILVIIILGILFAYKDALIGETMGQIEGVGTLQPELKEAGEGIEACVKQVSEEAILQLGMRSGYMDNSRMDTFDYSGLKTTYLYIDEESKLLSKKAMAVQLSDYMKKNAYECSGLELEGFTITPGDIGAAESEINQESVDIAIEWPITITKGNLESTLDGFSFTIPVRLGLIQQEVEEFMQIQITNPGEICLSCLLELNQYEGISVELDNFITTYVFTIKDENMMVNEQPFNFIFASGY